MTLDYNVTDSRSIKSFTTLQERFSNIHKNRYDYTNFIYSKAKAKSTIICQLHGEFQLSADEHLAGTGCSKCGFEHVANLRRMGIDTFILNSSKIHGDKYDYSKGIYVNNTTPVTIICPDHGEFQQAPATHLKGGECPDCASQSRILRLRSDTKSFIKKANVTHDNYYNYSKVSYIDNSTNIVIICPIHGEFEQQPANHLQGKGCSNCAVSGFKTHLPGILYYVKVQKDNTVLYKIGITNKTIKIRFKSDFQYITVLHQIHYKNGQEAYNEEQRILKQFKEFKYIGPDILKSGNTELFIKDILSMNNSINYINKALYMEIIKPTITISITKTELNTLIAEALTNPDTAATIKRAISPLLANSFPQFPDFTNITLGETAEDGTTAVILKQPKQVEPKVDSPIQSMEPLVVTEPDEMPTPAYVEPTEA